MLSISSQIDGSTLRSPHVDDEPASRTLAEGANQISRSFSGPSKGNVILQEICESDDLYALRFLFPMARRFLARMPLFRAPALLPTFRPLRPSQLPLTRTPRVSDSRLFHHFPARLSSSP